MTSFWVIHWKIRSDRIDGIGMGTVKTGWLQKLSGFFKNTWKRRYFVLYSDGQFCYFQNPDDRERDGQIHMKTECRRIDVGHEVGEGVKAPKNTENNALFSVTSPGRTWFLCAETEAECRDWVKVLEEARTPLAYQASVPSMMPTNPYPSPVGPPPPYSQGMPQPSQVPPPSAPYPQQGPGQLPPYSSQPSMPYPQQQPYPQHPRGPYPQQQSYPQHPQGPSYPTSAYPTPQQPNPYQPYPQGMQPHYPPPPPGYGMPPRHPSQQYYPGATTYTQQPGHQSHSGGGRKNLMMGAAAGALGGAAMGYMVGNALGGFGHHSYGGWDSDHSWSSGGSFDCGFD